MSPSSSTRRAASASGSKVITDPREAGSDLLELRFERLGVLLGHRYAPWHFLNFLPLPHQQGSLRPMFSRSDLTIGRGAPAVVVVPPVIAIVAVPAALPPAAAIASEASRASSLNSSTSDSRETSPRSSRSSSTVTSVS